MSTFLPAVFQPIEGVVAQLGPRRIKILKLVDVTSARVVDLDTSEKFIGNVAEMEPVPDDSAEADIGEPSDLTIYSDADWKIAEERLAALKPLIGSPTRTTEQVQQAADTMGVCLRQAYRFILRFEATGKTSYLLPRKPEGGKGRGRLDQEPEQIIKHAIGQVYLNKQRKRGSAVVERVNQICNTAGIDPPSPATIRRRIKDLRLNMVAGARRSGKEARALLRINREGFGQLDFPLQLVQVDSTPLDVIVVSEDRTELVGRAYLTLVFDVCTRCVLGWHISLDPPRFASVASALVMAILPKDDLRREYDLETDYPCYGLPDLVQADGGSEHDNKYLRRSLSEWDIGFELRPALAPQVGGHIERMFGTINPRVHELAGTTFSNVEMRGDYESEKKAVMTLADLRHWFATFVVEVYHNKIHSSLGTTPIAKWREGILGNPATGKPGRGAPRHVLEVERLRIDFMPFEELTLQDYGIRWDYIHYYSPVLDQLIHSSKKARSKKKFVVRRHPDDISHVHLWEPKLRQYFEIPYRNLANPSMSLDEFRRVRALLQNEGLKDVNEDAIFRGLERMRKIEAGAKKSTMKARRDKARAIEAKKNPSAKSRTTAGPKPLVPPPSTPIASLPSQSATRALPKAFDDLQD